MSSPPKTSTRICVVRGLLAFFLATVAGQREVKPAAPPPSNERSLAHSGKASGPDIKAADWPGWRGPNGLGMRAEAMPVLRWSPTSGVLWKAAISGVGHASPIVVGGRVVVSTADEEANTRSLYCYSLEKGTFQWKTTFHQGGFMGKHEKNSHASPTPVSDGVLVFVPYIAGDSLWLSAINLRDGRIEWQPRIGSFVSEHGYASSPALYKDFVIVAGDNKGAPYGPGDEPTSYLVAVHRKTGAVVWRVPRPLAPSYGSPVVAHLAGRDQLLMSGAERVVAYDPATGKELWFCRWSGYRSASSVVCGDNRVFASTNWPRDEIVCVRADGTGDVSETHVVWRQDRSGSDVSSPLYHDGRLYQITDRGIAVCRDAATGEVQWQQRLGTTFSASAVLAGDRIVAADERGTTHVFQSGPQFKLLARNALEEPILASPALSGERILMRSHRFMWCIDGKATSTAFVQTPDRSSEQRVFPPRNTTGRIGVTVKQEERERVAAPPVPKSEAKRSYTIIALAGLQLLLLLLLGGVLLVVYRRRQAPALLGLADVIEIPDPPPPATGIVFFCTGCQRKLRGAAAMAGKKIRCPKCSSIVVVSANPISS
jgi:outer membrane protein assembly factor BamB